MKIKRSLTEYPSIDLTPEHTKRSGQSIHPDIEAAYKYVESIQNTSDFKDDLCWFGWAIREAFLAGISYANSTNASIHPIRGKK